MNECLQADIHILVTPRLIRWFSGLRFDRSFLPTPGRLCGRVDALSLRSKMVPEAQRATVCRVLATMEIMNKIILESRDQPEFSNEATSPDALKQVETFNKSFRDAFNNTKGGQQVVCVWKTAIGPSVLRNRSVYFYHISIVTSSSVSGCRFP
jgi:hypothetical protein